MCDTSVWNLLSLGQQAEKNMSKTNAKPDRLGMILDTFVAFVFSRCKLFLHWGPTKLCLGVRSLQRGKKEGTRLLQFFNLYVSFTLYVCSMQLLQHLHLLYSIMLFIYIYIWVRHLSIVSYGLQGAPKRTRPYICINIYMFSAPVPKRVHLLVTSDNNGAASAHRVRLNAARLQST